MKMIKLRVLKEGLVCKVLFVSCIVLYGLIAGNTALSQDFQKVPITLKASEALPQQWLKGPNYTIKETITNDGVVSIYGLDNTNYGNERLLRAQCFC